MLVVDSAIYVDGHRAQEPSSLDETYDLLRGGRGMAWIGLYRPDPAELHSVATEFGLHHLAVDDALAGHQRPKLERYGHTLFVVLRPARYLKASETVDFGELHVFAGPQFVITIRHAESPDLRGVRHRLEHNAELLAFGPEAVLYAILDQVVDEYAPVVVGLQTEIDEIEDRLFGADPGVSRRIYDALRKVIGLQRAVHPLIDMLEALRRGSDKYEVDHELRHTLRDVLDHVRRIDERADAFHLLLQNALSVQTTLVNQRQNEELKKISSWAAILFAPTVIGTIYGMNFDAMPELHWQLGYPLAIAAMLAMGGALYAVFKSKRWL